MNQIDLDWFAARLSIAVHETRRLTPEMSAYELRAALRGIDGSESLTVSYSQNGNQLIHIGDKTLEVGPMASNDEIAAALKNPFIRTENTKMSISGYQPGAIRDRLNALKEQGRQRRDQALAKLDDAGKKHEEVSAEIERVAIQIEKEADAAIAEFAEFTNGGPA
jgi:DNA anti-recombination protein RmuC